MSSIWSSEPKPGAITNDWTDKVITVDIFTSKHTHLNSVDTLQKIKEDADASFHFEIPPGCKLNKVEKRKPRRSSTILFVLEIPYPEKGK